MTYRQNEEKLQDLRKKHRDDIIEGRVQTAMDDDDLISVSDEMVEPDENFLYLKIQKVEYH